MVPSINSWPTFQGSNPFDKTHHGFNGGTCTRLVPSIYYWSKLVLFIEP